MSSKEVKQKALEVYYAFLLMALASFTIAKYDLMTFIEIINHPFVITTILLLALPTYYNLLFKDNK